MASPAKNDNASSLQALIGADEEVVVLKLGEGDDVKEVKFTLKAPLAMEVAAIGDKYKNSPNSRGIDIEILALCLKLPPETITANFSNNPESDKLLAAAYRLAGLTAIADSIENSGKEGEGKSRLEKAADKGVILGPGATMEETDKGEVDEPNPLSSK